MPLKLLKVQVNLEVKADSSDDEEIRERVYEELQTLLESEELTYTVDEEDQEDADDES